MKTSLKKIKINENGSIHVLFVSFFSIIFAVLIAFSIITLFSLR